LTEPKPWLNFANFKGPLGQSRLSVLVAITKAGGENAEA